MTKEFWYGFTSVTIAPDLRRRHTHLLTMNTDRFARHVMYGQAVFFLSTMGLVGAAFVLMFLGFSDVIVATPCFIAVALTVFQWRMDSKIFPFEGGRG